MVLRLTLQVTLAELYNGVSKEIEVKRSKICTNCEGLGAPESMFDCILCDCYAGSSYSYIQMLSEKLASSAMVAEESLLTTASFNP